MGLELGSRCIGFLHLIVSLVLMVLCSVFAENLRSYVGTVEDAGDALYSTWYKIAVSVAVVTVVHVLLALTLIYSVHKRWVAGVRAWLVVMVLLWAAALLALAALAALRGLSGSGSDIFLSFLEGVLFFGAVAYCILCVYSYYLMLKSAEDMEGPKTMY